jgi:hypothetical protein
MGSFGRVLQLRGGDIDRGNREGLALASSEQRGRVTSGQGEDDTEAQKTTLVIVTPPLISWTALECPLWEPQMLVSEEYQEDLRVPAETRPFGR